MKCEGVGCNQPTAPKSRIKKYALTGALLAGSAHGAMYAVSSSCLWGLKNKSIAQKREVISTLSEKFGRVADMSKTTCSKFAKNLLKDFRSPKLISRVLFKAAVLGGILGLTADLYNNYSSKMDYKRN